MGVWLMKKAVAYARFSSDNQHEESIVAQLRAIREYAAKENVTIIKEYIDEARSATTDDRPNFLKMIKEITSGRLEVDFVFVHKLDRFARNRYDSAIYRRELAKHGVKLIAVAQPLGDGPESIIMEAMIEAMAEYYSKNLSHEVKTKMKEHARQGKHLGGTPPLGYEVVVQKDGTKKYVINEREAEAVRLIFRMVADGYGYSKIIDTLNARGYKTKRGNRFGKNSIYEILRNEKYIGIYVFNKTASANMGKRNNHAKKDDSEIVRIPGGIPAIITTEEWEAVQKILNSREKGPRSRQRSNIIYILTGKAVCGECGAAYTGKSQTAGRNKKKYSLYSCTAKKQKRTCTNRDIRKEILENYVLDEIAKLLDPINVDEFAERIQRRYEELYKDSCQEIEQITNAITELKNRMDKLFELIEKGNADPTIVGPRLNGLAKEKETMENRLMRLESQYRTPLTKKQIADYLKLNQHALIDRQDMLACKRLTDAYVEKVVIYPDQVKVIFKFPMSDALNSGGGGPYLTLYASINKDAIFMKYG